MKIQITAHISDKDYKVGLIYDVPAEEARKYIEDQQAIALLEADVKISVPKSAKRQREVEE